MRLAHLLIVLATFVLVACSGVETKLKCTSNADCLADTTGIQYRCDLAQTQVCLRECRSDDDCLDSMHCDLPGDGSPGLCRDGAPGGDPAAGDPAGGDPASGDPASGDPAAGD